MGTTTRAMTVLALVMASMFVGGCAISVGHEFDSSYVDQIKIGETTKQDIRREIGEPHAITRNGKTETWEYMHYQGGNFAQNMASGLGGRDIKAHDDELSIMFAQGVVSDFSLTRAR